MRRFLLLCALCAAVVAALAAPSMTAGIGPPGGTIYAFDEAFRTVGTPTSLPNRGQFDTLYHVPGLRVLRGRVRGGPGAPGLQRGTLAGRGGVRDHDAADERRGRRRAGGRARRHRHPLRLSADQGLNASGRGGAQSRPGPQPWRFRVVHSTRGTDLRLLRRREPGRRPLLQRLRLAASPDVPRLRRRTAGNRGLLLLLRLRLA